MSKREQNEGKRRKTEQVYPNLIFCEKVLDKLLTQRYNTKAKKIEGNAPK